jgi:DNA-directed RNA polymerase subunit H (RpoH/RPB5)
LEFIIDFRQAATEAFQVGSYQINAEVLPRINKSDIAVKYPDEYGGKYMGGIEVFHQLHCLVSLF